MSSIFDCIVLSCLTENATNVFTWFVRRQMDAQVSLCGREDVDNIIFMVTEFMFPCLMSF